MICKYAGWLKKRRGREEQNKGCRDHVSVILKKIKGEKGIERESGMVECGNE